MTLNELPEGKTAIVKDMHLQGQIRRRFLDLGVIPGTKVQCALRSPHGGPAIYRLRESSYAFREVDAKEIEINLIT